MPEKQLVELITAEDKLKIREFQLTILQHANLRLNLEKQFIEATKIQETAQNDLNKLVEEIKPKEGKWDLQNNLTWKRIEEPLVDSNPIPEPESSSPTIQ